MPLHAKWLCATYRIQYLILLIQYILGLKITGDRRGPIVWRGAKRGEVVVLERCRLGECAPTHHLGEEVRRSAASPLSPQKDQRCHETESTSPGMEHPTAR